MRSKSYIFNQMGTFLLQNQTTAIRLYGVSALGHNISHVQKLRHVRQVDLFSSSLDLQINDCRFNAAD